MPSTLLNIIDLVADYKQVLNRKIIFRMKSTSMGVRPSQVVKANDDIAKECLLQKSEISCLVFLFIITKSRLQNFTNVYFMSLTS